MIFIHELINFHENIAKFYCAIQAAINKMCFSSTYVGQLINTISNALLLVNCDYALLQQGVNTDFLRIYSVFDSILMGDLKTGNILCIFSLIEVLYVHPEVQWLP